MIQSATARLRSIGLAVMDIKIVSEARKVSFDQFRMEVVQPCPQFS
jgi:hypothetical protein